MKLNKLWPSGLFSFDISEDGNSHKIVFLNSVFLFAGIVALCMGFFRIRGNFYLGLADFLYSCLAFSLIFHLNRHRAKVELISNLAIVASFVLFYIIYLLAVQNTSRVSLFFLLVAAAFFLKGRKAGMLWMGIVLLSMIAAELFSYAEPGYSRFDILTASLYLVALVFIFNNYEVFLEDKNMALSEGNQRFTTLIETLPDAVFLKNGDGRWQIANKTGLELFHLQDKPWLGKTDLELAKLVPELAEAFETCAKTDEEAFQHGDIMLFEERVSQNGITNDFEVRKFPRFSADGSRAGLVAIVRNVTERKRVENELRVSENRFRLMFEKTADALLLLDPKTGEFIDCNQAAMDMLGFRDEHLVLPLSPAELSPEYQPDGQLSRVKAEVMIATAMHNGSHRFEWTHCSKNRDSFPVEVLLTPVMLEEKQLIITTWRDITLQKRAERELRIAATAFESQEAVMVTDEHQVILKVNQAFTKITGFSAEEAVGKTPDLIKSGRQDEMFYQEMWDGINHQNFWQGEIWNRRKNGEGYPEWLSITAIRDNSGKVLNYVATFTDITLRKKAEETIRSLSFYDGLTGLPNRRLLLERLKNLLSFSTTKKTQGALLFINLDDFKTLNDTRGHDIGDKLLVEVAGRIRGCVHLDDTVARIGGDDFVVALNLLNTETDIAANEAGSVAERIRKAIKQPFDLDGYEYNCTACVGISLFRDHETTVEDLLKHADAAMFQAKQSGSDRIHFFDANMQAMLEERVELESMLRKAIPGQLKLYYQPQVDYNGNILGAEVLIRWQHPEKGMISPAAFIPLAERFDFILPIGLWVLETACLQLKAWESQQSKMHLKLSVNVSAKQFRQADFVDQVLEVVKKTGADPAKLKLELTESMLVNDVESTIAKMIALKAHGVCFSLDDFGTGFSSLSYLKRLPLSQLKIDQSFVRDLLTDPNDAAIIRTIVALGQSLGLEVIAEGVETEEQRSALSVNGCHNYQGYLFGQPMEVADFEKILVSA